MVKCTISTIIILMILISFVAYEENCCNDVIVIYHDERTTVFKITPIKYAVNSSKGYPYILISMLNESGTPVFWYSLIFRGALLFNDTDMSGNFTQGDPNVTIDFDGAFAMSNISLATGLIVIDLNLTIPAIGPHDTAYFAARIFVSNSTIQIYNFHNDIVVLQPYALYLDWTFYSKDAELFKEFDHVALLMSLLSCNESFMISDEIQTDYAGYKEAISFTLMTNETIYVGDGNLMPRILSMLESTDPSQFSSVIPMDFNYGYNWYVACKAIGLNGPFSSNMTIYVTFYTSYGEGPPPNAGNNQNNTSTFNPIDQMIATPFADIILIGVTIAAISITIYVFSRKGEPY